MWLEKVKTDKRLRSCALTVFFMVVSAIYLFFFSVNTSYLYNWTEGDAAIYWAMGRFATKGMVPYLDFFDHKGPLMFFIEYVGNLISYERIGIFLVQLVFMTFTLWGIFKILTLFYSLKNSLKMTMFSLLLINLYYSIGNLTEEYSLPFLMWSVYFVTKYFKSEEGEDKVHNPWYAFFYGITFAVCFLIRLTNAVPLCCVVAVGFVDLVYRKKWKNIFCNICTFLLGCGITFLPFVVYFLQHGALYEMFDAAFLHNITYVTVNDKMLMYRGAFIITYFLLIFVLTTAIGVISFCFDKKNRWISACIIFMNVAAIALQLKLYAYSHYFLIWIPMFILVVGVIPDIINSKKAVVNATKIIAGIILVIVLSLNCMAVVDNVVRLDRIRDNDFVACAKQITEDITEADKDDILAYNVDSYFYIVTDTLPSIRYFMLQDEIGDYSEKTRIDFEKEMKKMKTKYIVVYKGSENHMNDFINENYDVVNENKWFTLFQMKE